MLSGTSAHTLDKSDAGTVRNANGIDSYSNESELGFVTVQDMTLSDVKLERYHFLELLAHKAQISKFFDMRTLLRLLFYVYLATKTKQTEKRRGDVGAFCSCR